MRIAACTQAEPPAKPPKEKVLTPPLTWRCQNANRNKFRQQITMDSARLIAAAVVALLAGAAYVWGNRLNADTQPAGTQRSADASAARYGSMRGVAAVRAVEIVPAPRSSTLQGLAAVRAADGEAALAPRTSAAAAAEVLNGRMVGIGSSITRETDAAGRCSMRQRGALKQTTRGLTPPRPSLN